MFRQDLRSAQSLKGAMMHEAVIVKMDGVGLEDDLDSDLDKDLDADRKAVVENDNEDLIRIGSQARK